MTFYNLEGGIKGEGKGAKSMIEKRERKSKRIRDKEKQRDRIRKRKDGQSERKLI